MNHEVNVPKSLLVKFERVKIINGLVKKIDSIVDAGKLLRYDESNTKHMIVHKQMDEEESEVYQRGV